MFNKIVIIGRLGKSPTMKATKTGNQMCMFTVAVNTGWGENRTTDWYSVTVFGKQAEICGSKLVKGSLVCVTGSLQFREFDAKDGQKRISPELTADSITFLSGHTEDKPQLEQPQQSGGVVFKEDYIEDESIPF